MKTRYRWPCPKSNLSLRERPVPQGPGEGQLFSILILIFACAAMAHADDSSQVICPISESLPRKLSTVVCGDLRGDIVSTRCFILQSTDLPAKSWLGQAEANAGRVWFAINLPEDIVGKELTLNAKPTDSEPTMRVVESDAGFEFRDGEQLVLFYQRQPVAREGHTRAGYVHPLVGLDGEEFTEVFPKDHRHHQGVFWAWHQLWVGDRAIGDPWVTRDHLVVVQDAKIVDEGPVFATLDVRAAWTSPLLTDESGQPRPIVEEQTRIRVFRALDEAVRYVDFTIQLKPLVPDVRLGGSDDEKGYSGFTVRIKPPGDLRIHMADGHLKEDAIQSASPWADASGAFAPGKTSGVAILTHPSLPRFPPHWVLRYYGMQNLAFPGRQPIPLSAEQPLVLRQRLVLHRGDVEQARIAEHQAAFEAVP